ncbi:MAG: tRNA (adenosine(37)-N6)-threonylcarbamoyltransferase complex ATPase subunit type 1 TsaE [Nitrospirota bacterium]|nr:tRNA (adenosine(37)-N6)-threonylcarbamoyltransferase complex ATPase subunit type 1 TsaE [Nitrospirota bacterium]
MSSPTDVSQKSGLPSLGLTLDSAEKTLAFGERVGHVLKGGDVLALTGDLGVGKTLITRGIALGLGIPAEQVNSPTFTLIQAYVYDSCVQVIHVDLYRLEHPSAIAQLGLEDYLTPQNIVIIEWADRCLQVLPPDYLVIHMEHGKTETLRHLTAKGTGPRSAHIVTTLLHDLPDNHAASQPSNNR